jgi:hypothetical protein
MCPTPSDRKQVSVAGQRDMALSTATIDERKAIMERRHDF